MTKLLCSIARSFLGLAILLAVAASKARAQQKDSPPPYDSIQEQGVSYAGPGREPAYDLKGPVIHIGIVAPLRGPEKADGEAILQAAQMAMADASTRPLPAGLQLKVAVGDESGPAWGHAADAIIHLVLDQHAIALVTSASGATAHLCEQVCNRLGVPVLTLSTDATTTQIDLPWIIRLGPSDVLQSWAIARDIFRVRGLQRVLLVTERDHDGRIGGREFIEAAHRLGALAPDSLVIDPIQPDVSSFLAVVRSKSPQAIVLWTRPENARRLLQEMPGEDHAAVYLSQEAAQTGSGVMFLQQPLTTAETEFPGAGIYTVASAETRGSSSEDFARRYFLATGTFPDPIAAEAYDAVYLIADAVRETGPNRARVRDHILKVQDLAGASGVISFDEQGNNRAGVRVVRLQPE